MIHPVGNTARRLAADKRNASMPRIVLLCFASAIGSIAALAQGAAPIDEKQCAEQFKAADLDNNAVLSRDEIGSFKQHLPTSLVGKDQVTRAEFMAACGKKAS
jgi:hypothetical protein